jgi:hypothetical protein
LFLVHRFLSPWWRRRQVPPKRRFLQEPHGVTTQKTPFFNIRSNYQLLVTANFVRSSPILFPLMMQAILSSETSVLTRATWCHIPEDGILHGHRRENVKSYTALTNWTLYRRRNVFLVRYEPGFLPQKTAFFNWNLFSIQQTLVAWCQQVDGII